MTDYSQMTDGEINESVHIAIHGGEFVDTFAGRFWIDPDGYDGEIRCPDYCNDWADIGPIIESNNIELSKELEEGDRWLAFVIDEYAEGFSAVDENPKRAEAICFLMMQGEG